MEIFLFLKGLLGSIPDVIQWVIVGGMAFLGWGVYQKRQGRKSGVQQQQEEAKQVDEQKAASTRRRAAKRVRDDKSGYRD